MLIHVWLSLNKAFFDSITLDKAGKNPGFSLFCLKKASPNILIERKGRKITDSTATAELARIIGRYRTEEKGEGGRNWEF